MTQGDEARGVDSDRVGGSRRLWRPVAGFLGGGLLIGALAGGLYGATRPTTYRAVTALSVLPDSAVTSQIQGTPAGVPSQDATAFIQSQLVVLNGNQLGTQVQRQLKLPAPPSLSSTQIGQTYVVEVAATAPVRQQALSAATTAAQVYTGQRRQQLGADVDAAIASVQKQLDSIRTNLNNVTTGTASTASPAPQGVALQSEYERLLAINSALQLSRAQVGGAVTTVSPANITAAGALAPTTKAVVEGGLLGVLLGLAALVLLRRAFPRVRTVGELAALGVPVLLPVLPRRSSLRGGSALGQSSEVRLLATRLVSRGAAPPPPVVIVGATRGVGTSFVAASLAANLAERGPVLLVPAAAVLTAGGTRAALGAEQPSPSGPATAPADMLKRVVPGEQFGVSVLPCTADGPAGVRQLRADLAAGLLDAATSAGFLVVVDAPALSDSDLALDAALGAGAVALVVGRSVSRPVEVLTAAELFDARGVLLTGAILNDAPGSLTSWTGRRPGGLAAGRPSAPPLEAENVRLSRHGSAARRGAGRAAPPGRPAEKAPGVAAPARSESAEPESAPTTTQVGAPRGRPVAAREERS